MTSKRKKEVNHGRLFAVYSAIRKQKEKRFAGELYRVRVWYGREQGHVQVRESFSRQIPNSGTKTKAKRIIKRGRSWHVGSKPNLMMMGL